jgi:hypothetical protein
MRGVNDSFRNSLMIEVRFDGFLHPSVSLTSCWRMVSLMGSALPDRIDLLAILFFGRLHGFPRLVVSLPGVVAAHLGMLLALLVIVFPMEIGRCPVMLCCLGVLVYRHGKYSP